MAAPSLHTSRLVLRHWTADDYAPFAALNADPETMRYFVAPLSRAESDVFADRARAALQTDDYGLWAVEVQGRFAGYVGLMRQSFPAAFTPAVEVGWRLARAHWGNGYATEAARAVLAHGFGTVGLTEIVSMTTVANQPSRRVMERLGMHHDPADDFDHPRVPPGHAWRRHVLYRLSAAEWRDTTGETAHTPA